MKKLAQRNILKLVCFSSKYDNIHKLLRLRHGDILGVSCYTMHISSRCSDWRRSEFCKISFLKLVYLIGGAEHRWILAILERRNPWWLSLLRYMCISKWCSDLHQFKIRTNLRSRAGMTCCRGKTLMNCCDFVAALFVVFDAIIGASRLDAMIVPVPNFVRIFIREVVILTVVREHWWIVES